MGECILAGFGRGGSGSGGSSSNMKLYTEIITENTTWKPPENMKDNKCWVRIFGGGGRGWYQSSDDICGGGGGGYMNFSEVSIPYGSTVKITIGRGGSGPLPTNGGTTSFGTYLSANGGESPNYYYIAYGNYTAGTGGSGGSTIYNNNKATHSVKAGDGLQFGGGACYYGSNASSAIGGYGGIWGGGGASVNLGANIVNSYGGNGGIYGGGGFGSHGGNGGTYGGGGGGYGMGGIGGTYGGNGGNYSGATATNGTNTSTWTNVDMIPGSIDDFNMNTNYIYLRGWGRAGTDTGAGGGGYGGNGKWGGGGYGGNGGSWGGGGYGGNGNLGGGGYGPGADGNGKGGAGFYTPSKHAGGAGFGIYGMGGDIDTYNSSGTNGVCIIQYWAP